MSKCTLAERKKEFESKWVFQQFLPSESLVESENPLFAHNFRSSVWITAESRVSDPKRIPKSKCCCLNFVEVYSPMAAWAQELSTEALATESDFASGKETLREF